MNEKGLLALVPFVLVCGYLFFGHRSADTQRELDEVAPPVQMSASPSSDPSASTTNDASLKELENRLASLNAERLSVEPAAARRVVDPSVAQPIDPEVSARFIASLATFRTAMESAQAELERQVTLAEQLKSQDTRSSVGAVIARRNAKEKVFRGFRADLKKKSNFYQSVYKLRDDCIKALKDSEVSAQCDATGEQLRSEAFELDSERSRLAIKINAIDQHIMDRPSLNSSTVNNPYAQGEKWW